MTPKDNIQLSLSLFHLLQALMLENLQKSSSSHCGLQPNSQVHIYSVSFVHFYITTLVNVVVLCIRLCVDRPGDEPE